MANSATVLLLGCVKSKLDHPAPAKDLYCSPLWAGRRAHAEASGHPWLILSAKHGLVDPEKRLEPYDLALANLPVADRRSWGARVIRGLERRFAPLNAVTFELHAGEVYRLAIEPGIVERGGRMVVPLEGLPRYAQVAWYTARNPSTASGTPERRRTCTTAELRRALRALDLGPLRIAASAWPAQLRDLDQAGIYSWWVDAVGAGDLSRGLGHRVKPGRIYVGQTGATKWPSGKVGKATLASRIGGNHLRGRILGSTFRLTLASVLAEPLGLVRTDPKHMVASSESCLSEWMREHLEVAVHPFSDRDALGDLERRVLARLDPPLNLGGTQPTPARLALSGLRAARTG